MNLIPVHSEYKNNFSNDILSNKKSTPVSLVKCKVNDISLEGMHFESDFRHLLNESPDLNTYNFVNLTKNYNLKFPEAKIKWKKELLESNYVYGYGIQFDQPFKDFEKFINNTKEKKQTPLSNILKIMGLTISFAYFLVIVFFSLKLFGEPFDLFIIGFGLIGFAHIIRIITKDHIEDDVIKNRPADSLLKMLVN